MDPITAASAITSSPLSDSLGAGETAAVKPNLLIQQSGGASFAFQLPQAAEVPAVSAAAPASQIYAVGDNGASGGHLIKDMITQVNSIQNVAGEKVRDVLMGGKTSVNDAMVAVEESSVAFTMASTVRDKLVTAYQQIMSMQV